MKSKIRFVEDMQFIGSADSGHGVVMDAPLSVGGNNRGSKPSELLLMGLGGCTGMDVISILRKKKQDVTNFEMNVTGDTSEKDPRSFLSFDIEYIICGRNISEDAVKRSIQISLEKYCLVGATLGKAADITHSYKIIQE